jgi:hypothetical protein
VEGENKPALVALSRRRAEVIDQLSEQFSRDALALEEFEERLDAAHQARTLIELDHLVTDLVPAGQTAPTTAPESAAATQATALEVHARDKKNMVAILGGVDRKGDWRPARANRVLAFMGGVDLDFREVQLPPGVTELKIAAIMGGIDIIVPPGLAVECEGFAILGGFDELDRAPVAPDPEQPLLRVTGFALMGGVDIHTRLPGESGWQARKRRKRERKAKLREAQRKAKLREAERKQLGDGS